MAAHWPRMGLPLSLVCLLIASCSSTTVRPASPGQGTGGSAQAPAVEADQADITLTSMFTLMTPLYLYYVEHDDWPSRPEELQQVAREWDIEFDLAEYSVLDMKELDDGRLYVKFQLAPPRSGQGEFTVSPPIIQYETPDRPGGMAA